MKSFKSKFLIDPFFQLKCADKTNLEKIIKSFNESSSDLMKEMTEIYEYNKNNYLKILFSDRELGERLDLFKYLSLFVLMHKNNEPLLILFPELVFLKKRILLISLEEHLHKNIHQILTIILLLYEYNKENIKNFLKSRFEGSKDFSFYILSTRFLILTIFLYYEKNISVALSIFFQFFLNFVRCYNPGIFLELKYDEFIYQKVFLLRFDKFFYHLSFIDRKENKNCKVFPCALEITKKALDVNYFGPYFRKCILEYISHNHSEKLKVLKNENNKSFNLEMLLQIFSEIEEEYYLSLYELIISI